MTFTSDRVSPILKDSGADLLPGSADVEWAERAFHRQPMSSIAPHRVMRRRARNRNCHRLRVLFATLVIVLAMAGLVGLLTQGGSSPIISNPAIYPATSTVSTSQASKEDSLTPPPLRPSPFSLPILATPTH
jgi:hypothetical protein